MPISMKFSSVFMHSGSLLLKHRDLVKNPFGQGGEGLLLSGNTKMAAKIISGNTKMVGGGNSMSLWAWVAQFLFTFQVATILLNQYMNQICISFLDFVLIFPNVVLLFSASVSTATVWRSLSYLTPWEESWCNVNGLTHPSPLAAFPSAWNSLIYQQFSVNGKKWHWSFQ